MATDSKESLEKGLLFTPDWNKLAGIQDKVLPVCLQQVDSGEVLAIMYMDKEAYDLSCKTRTLTLFSTSRKEIWIKGEVSGEMFEVVNFYTNCEQNALLCIVRPKRSGICHVKKDDGVPHNSCFYRKTGSLDYPYLLNPCED